MTPYLLLTCKQSLVTRKVFAYLDPLPLMIQWNPRVGYFELGRVLKPALVFSSKGQGPVELVDE